MVSSYANNIDLAALFANSHTSNALLRTSIGQSESLTNTAITGRTKDKFSQGFLGGCGSTSQFQGTHGLPIAPYRSNNDLIQRTAASRGVAGERLMPGWERSYAFAPGRGIQALYTRITQTDAEAGRSTISGVVAPLVNPGVDRFGDAPTGPLVGGGSQVVMQQAPYSALGGEAADETQNAIVNKQNALVSRQIQARKSGVKNFAAPKQAGGGRSGFTE